jgi:spore coat protein SA
VASKPYLVEPCSWSSRRLLISQSEQSFLPHTYHLLAEAEPFSEHAGGATSRWAANVLRNDKESTIIASSADSSWGFVPGRVRIHPVLGLYKHFPPRLRTPWIFRRQVLRAILAPPLASLCKGDVVWVHNRPEFALALEPLITKANAHLVLHMHNAHLTKLVARDLLTAGLVFCSDFLRREALTRIPHLPRSSVIHNGADEQLFYPKESLTALPSQTPDDPTILFVGRLVPDKGVHIFVKAMALLHERLVPAKGVIIGASGFGGSGETEYIRDLRRSASPNTEFQPYCSGTFLADKFREADVFCCPSTFDEPFGMVNVEAMACALPVVASEVGGIPEVFAQGGAILVSRNSASKLAQALESLITNPELRREIGQAGYRSFRQNFTWSKVYERYQKVLASVVSQGSLRDCQLENVGHDLTFLW